MLSAGKMFHTTSVKLKSKGKLVTNKNKYQNVLDSRVFCEKKGTSWPKQALKKRIKFGKTNFCTFLVLSL